LYIDIKNGVHVYEYVGNIIGVAVYINGIFSCKKCRKVWKKQ